MISNFFCIFLNSSSLRPLQPFIILYFVHQFLLHHTKIPNTNLVVENLDTIQDKLRYPTPNFEMPIAKSRPKKGEKNKDKTKAKVSKDEKAGESVFDMESLKDTVIDDGGRVSSGVLISEPRARDIKISSFSLALHGINLVEDTIVELNNGRRYGLLGRNGCGKSTFLKCLAAREIPIPDIFDIYLLAHEAPPSEFTALDYVIQSARDEIEKLDAAIENILVTEGPESDLLMMLYDRQDELDPSTFETRASTILCGTSNLKYNHAT